MDRNVVLKYLLDNELDKRISTPNAITSELMGKVIEVYEKLSAMLSGELLKMLDDYKDCLDAYHAEEILNDISQSFLAGMDFGLALKAD